MNHLTRDELIEIGVSLPSGPLTAWAAKQLANARSMGDRLRSRGLGASFLNEVRGLIGSIRRCRTTLGPRNEQVPPPILAARGVAGAAIAYLREAGLVAEIEFGSTPHLFAPFHTGVRVGALVSGLLAELESTVARLRDHSARLQDLGVDDIFLRTGGLLVRLLGEAQGGLQPAIDAMPPLVAEWCHQKGRLYDLTRMLVRIGRLEFIREPARAAIFNYDRVRGTASRSSLESPAPA